MRHLTPATQRGIRAVLTTARLAPLIVLVALGCSDQVTLPSEARQAAPRASSTVALSAPWTQIVDGQTGPGSRYRLFVPVGWNGKLVVYAHSAIAPFLPVAMPPEVDAIASLFGAQGYAVAASSFSETGGAIKDGAQRTHQLRGLFAAQFGQPSRTYLVGASMGGFIAASLAERFPGQYDGAMPMCGVVGGFPSQFQYLLNARVLFDYLYPGVLPGGPTNVPLPSDPVAATAAVLAIQNLAVGAIQTDARPVPGALQIALIDQTSMPLPSTLGGPLTPEQFVEFVVSPLVLHAVFINDAVDQTHGHFPFTNVGTTYSSPAPFMASLLPAINAGVARVSSDPAGVSLVDQNGETSGQLGIPMLTLHSRFDPEVPIISEAIYKQKVQAAGNSSRLVQRTTNEFGHCTFTPQEVAQSFSDLVAWVEQGVKPVP